MTAGVSAHKSLTYICVLLNIYSPLMAMMSEPEVSVTPALVGTAAATSDPAYLPNTYILYCHYLLTGKLMRWCTDVYDHPAHPWLHSYKDLHYAF